MNINRLLISNFKSFDELDIVLDNFNMLIGSNASGKSNFIKIFEFLRDIAQYGLDNAISMQGGVEYLRNINNTQKNDISLRIISTNKLGFGIKTKRGLIGIKTHEIDYGFIIRIKGKLPSYEIVEDKLLLKCDFFELKKERGNLVEKDKIGEGEITLTKVRHNIKSVIKPPKGFSLEKDEIIPYLALPQPYRELPEETALIKKLLLIQPPFSFVPVPWGAIFTNISIFDFDPKLPKTATKVTGKAELDYDGSNLAIILKNIIENKEKKRHFFNLLQDVLPFITNVGIEKFADKSLLFKILEIYSKSHYIPASLVSDGTINVISLIVSLFFDKRKIIIIEEPERNIHPYIISKIMSMMKEASKEKQFITTTHNPEILKHVSLDNLMLIKRNGLGNSLISKPDQKEEVKIFLQNQIGIEDLFIQNLLEI